MDGDSQVAKKARTPVLKDHRAIPGGLKLSFLFSSVDQRDSGLFVGLNVDSH